MANELKLTKIGAMLMLALTFILSAFSLMPTVEANAFDELDISMSGGKLQVSGGGMDYQDSDSAWTSFLAKYKNFIIGISGVGTITMIGVFIYNFMKLGTTSTNPSERAKVLQGLVWSALAAAGLGAVTIIVGFFYGSLKDN